MHHKNERKVAGGNVVDGEEFVGQRHHKSAGSLYEYGVEHLQQPPGGCVNDVERYVAAVKSGRELWRAGMGIYQRGGSVVEVGRQQTCFHYRPVQQNVLRHVGVACLHKFLCYGPDALPCQFVGKPSCAVGFAGIGVDSAYKPCTMHRFEVRCRYVSHVFSESGRGGYM